MSASPLPENGAPRIGQVNLPAGRRILAGWGSPGPVAWVTDGPVEDPGLVWSALSRESAVTGLVPFLAATLEDEGTRAQVAESLALADGAGLDSDYEDYDDRHYDYEDLDDESGGRFGERGRPWDNNEFGAPEDIAGLGGIDSASLQAASWERQAPSEQDMAEDDEWRQMIAPFSSRFPGLAPPGTRRCPLMRSTGHCGC